TTVAEGVETPAELQWVQEHGVDLVQGFLIGKPAPVPVRTTAREDAGIPCTAARSHP
ncbi:MAG: EAL domain-containing protein, partial [Cyanobacteriota bacterium]